MACEAESEKFLIEAVENLQEAVAAKKCWPCGCLHGSLAAIERALPEGGRPPALQSALSEAQGRVMAQHYDCLGCEICYPAAALNALGRAGYSLEADACSVAPVAERRAGWPPLPGSYTVLRYQAAVAVCTLTSESLAKRLVEAAPPGLAIVGTLQTENLGIERLVQNVVANPNIRFLVVCGAESHQAIGHLPGASLLAFARFGVDDRLRIVGAPGKRPVLRTVPREALEHFRQAVEVVDCLGDTEISALTTAVRDCAARDPGPAPACAAASAITPIRGHLPARVISDPAGYFIVYVDRARRLLSLEHYRTDGVLDAIIEGQSAGELYVPAIERGLVSRLDHAAYLGQELARAESALLAGQPFVQDAAPDAAGPPPPVHSCGCEATGSETT